MLCTGLVACAEAPPLVDASPTYVTPDAQPSNTLNTLIPSSPLKSLSLHSGTHACVLSTAGTVKCWGTNDSGQLGLGDTLPRGAGAGQMGDALPAVFTGLARITDVAAGTGSTCVIGSNGEVKCWGRNDNGQLGAGDTVNRGILPGDMGPSLPLVPLGVGRRALHLALGTNHTCVLMDDGNVRCWGNNEAGQLGVGDTATRGDQPSELGDGLPTVNLGTGRTAVAIGSGAEFSCALLDNAQVKCWGSNALGQLGLGDTVSRGQTTNMGDNLPAVNFGTNAAVASLSVGQTHSCVLLTNGQVKCWGDNSYCMLGLGDQANRGSAANQMGTALPSVQLGTGRIATQVGAGWGGACVVLDTGALKCWGYNYYGGVGVGDGTNRGCTSGQMGDALPAVSLGSNAGTVLQVHMAGVYACALLQGGVKCWGYNDEGNLGLGDTLSRGTKPTDLGDNLPLVPLFQ